MKNHNDTIQDIVKILEEAVSKLKAMTDPLEGVKFVIDNVTFYDTFSRIDDGHENIHTYDGKINFTKMTRITSDYRNILLEVWVKDDTLHIRTSSSGEAVEQTTDSVNTSHIQSTIGSCVNKLIAKVNKKEGRWA